MIQLKYQLWLSLFLWMQPVSARFNVQLLLQSMSQDSNMRSAFSDPQVCYDHLINSDIDSSYQLDRYEYSRFAQLSGPPGFLRGVSRFDDLPLALQSAFLALSCLCPDTSKTDCCNDLLDINGSGGDANSREENNLFLICSLSRVAIDYVISSGAPTTIPDSTALPTGAPTQSPTKAPTLSPTPLPSSSPTSMKPSASPTLMASNAPTIHPSKEPSPGPSSSPSATLAFNSAAPSTVPTSSPEPSVSVAPTPLPTTTPIGTISIISYKVGVTSGPYNPEFEPLLIGAMNSLVQDVLVATLGERRVLRRRKLQSVTLPTKIFMYLQDECDALLPSDDGCAIIQASVALQFPSGDRQNADTISEEFARNLDVAIASGELQDKLNAKNSRTALYIIDDPLLESLESTNSFERGTFSGKGDDGEGTGAGVAIGATVAVAFCLLYYIWTNQELRREPKDELDELRPAPRSLDFPEDKEGHLVEIEEESQLVPLTPDYKKKKFHSQSLSPNRAEHDSDAGDSGWSSSAGYSSLNTGDNHGEDLDEIQVVGQIGSSLGTPSSSGQDDVSVPTTSSVTRADLDTAIEAGDWAAVGATAALLAAASDSNSFSSRSLTNPGTSTRDGSTDSSYEAAQAAEMDHLVDAGDWEGVVLAAARFEASTVASDSESRMSSSLASSYSKTRKQQDYRAQLEDLVARVVPEESENIDEMMLQFRGREDELLETLKVMEERRLAQEANAGVGAIVNKSLGTGTLTPQRKGGSVTSSLNPPVRGSVKSLGTGVVHMSVREQKQSQLEKAIEAGDWEAVGEAAALLNDAGSASSADTEEINRLADGLSSSNDGGTLYSTESGKKRAAKAEELDKLIDQGDWMGVVQAAADSETQDDKSLTGSKSWLAKKQKQEGMDAKQSAQLNRLKAEQEALKQAEIWMTIAEKSKDDSKDDQGASEAAEWAIGRSLAALAESEGKSDKPLRRDENTEEHEV